MHAKSVKRTNRIVLVSQRVHDDKVLVFVVFGIPQRVARGAGRHEAERLVDRNRAAVLFRHAHPDAVHAQAGRFGRETVGHHTRHGVTGVAAATVFTAQDDLDAGGLGPAVDVDKENHADDIIGAGRIELTVIVMVGVSQYGPCDGAAGFRITHTGFGGCLTGFPSLGAADPRVYDGAFGDRILTCDLGCAIEGIKFIQTRQVLDGGGAQVHHFATDWRNDDALWQIALQLRFGSHAQRLVGCGHRYTSPGSACFGSRSSAEHILLDWVNAGNALSRLSYRINKGSRWRELSAKRTEGGHPYMATTLSLTPFDSSHQREPVNLISP